MWLLTGKTLYFFTVLLSGSGSLPYTLPICVGFLFLGMSYGFFMRSQGFSFVYPLFMSLFIFAGSMEFVTANLLLLPTFQPVQRFSEGGTFEGGPSLFGFSVVFCVQVAYNKLIS